MKRTMIHLFALLLFCVGLTVAASNVTASATDDTGTCVPSSGTEDTYEWVDLGEPVLTEENTPPDSDGVNVRYRPLGSVDQDVQTGTKEVFDHWQRYSWTGGPHASDDAPPFPSADWQPNVEGDPHGVGVAGPYFRSHGNSGKGDWFYLEAVTKTVPVYGTDTDYLWQKQVRELIPGTPAVECPPVEECPNGDLNGEAPGCDAPPVECPQGDLNGALPGCDAPEVPVVPVTPETPQTSSTEQSCTATKCVKITKDSSGKVIDRDVVKYEADVKEEGL